eukprot:gene19084-22851_t
MVILKYINDGIAGADGEDGYDGRCGIGSGSQGLDGGDGSTGMPGISAGSVDVTLSSEEDGTMIIVSGKEGPNELILSSVGGAAGKGGDGGDGGRGAMGRAGMNATRYSCGTSGSSGGNGGDGGRGAGSQRSDYQVQEQEMLEKEELEVQEEVEEWEAAEVVGISGSNGVSGTTGARGLDGPSGKNGVFRIELTTDSGHINIYTSPYDLEVKSINYQDSLGYGIIEPGSQVHLGVTHTNVGGMPTPSKQNIHSYVSNNKWVNCPEANRVPMDMCLPKGTTTILCRPIVFNVKDIRHTNPIPKEPFVDTGHMEHQALVERVNQSFDRVAKSKSRFTIEYPTQCSKIKGHDCITLGQEAPIIFSIWNKSKLGIGKDIKSVMKDSPTRELFVRFRVHLKGDYTTNRLQPTDIIIRNIQGQEYPDHHHGLQANCLALAPGQHEYFAATLEFSNSDIKPYTRVRVEANLYLGHVKQMMDAQLIQSRPFDIQLAEGYQPIQGADFLLVTNNKTEYDEVCAWRSLVKNLGRTMNVWNVNLYKDLCLAHVKKNGTSLLQDFQCKTIIFLNNSYTQDERLVNASGFIRARELFNAAKHHGIHTVIVGSNFNLVDELIPIVDGQSPAYFKSTQHYISSIKCGIVPGVGSAMPIPASIVPDLSTMIMVEMKLRFVSLYTPVRTLCIYQAPTDMYPLETVYLGGHTVNVIDDTSFDIVLSRLDKTISFTEPVDKHRINKCSVVADKLGTDLNFVANGSMELADAIEAISNNFSIPASDSSTTTKKGVLQVRRDGSASGIFKSCYFVLNVAERTLTRHGRFKLFPTKHIYSLSRYSIIVDNDLGNQSASDRMRTFQIFTPSNKALFLRAKTQEDRDSWIIAFSALPAIGFTQAYKDSAYNLKKATVLKKSRVNTRFQESNIVNYIPVNEHYFFTKPKATDLEQRAIKLQKKLANRFPNQRNIVVYKRALNKLDSFKLYHLGTLEVHRSLDTTTPHIVQINVGTNDAIHSPNSVNAVATIYNVVKVLDFHDKLCILDEMIGRGETSLASTYFSGFSPINMLIISIVSDIAEEQFQFRRSKWRDTLSPNRIYSLIHTLNTLKNYNFKCMANEVDRGLDTLLGDIMIEIGTHLFIMCTAFSTLADKILPCRRGTDVTWASKRLWKEIIMVQAQGISLDKAESSSSKFDQSTMKYLHESKKSKKYAWRHFAINYYPAGVTGYLNLIRRIKNKPVIIDWYRSPNFSHSTVDCMAPIEPVMTQRAFQSKFQAKHKSQVQENRGAFNSDSH